MPTEAVATSFADAHEILRDRWTDYTLNLPCLDADTMTRLVRAIGGKWVKTTDNAYFILQREISPDVRIDVYSAHKNVCERVVTGTRTVKRFADDAPMVEVEEDVVEWVCPPSLLASAKGDA